jgi:hypothetical protein
MGASLRRDTLDSLGMSRLPPSRFGESRASSSGGWVLQCLGQRECTEHRARGGP